jgi:anti-sigma regulatory factor (Ser/Thr protein kinase)
MKICTTNTTYSAAAHDEVLEQWDQVRKDDGPLQLDLSRVQFIDPYGITGLVLFLNNLPPEALPVALKLPGWPVAEGPVRRDAQDPAETAGPVSYLARMGFWEAVADKLDAPGEQIPQRPAWSVDRNVLLDLTVFRTHDTISEMLRQTGDILQNLGYTVPARGHVLEVLSELCSNVLLHAQSEFGGVAAMQTYHSRGGTRYVVMGIGDAGIGVRRSLAANLALADRLESDAQALSVATQPGASRFAVGGHGGGLPRVLEIARRYGGRVAFRSGAGALAYNGVQDERRTFEKAPLRGTQLRISLPEARLRGQEQDTSPVTKSSSRGKAG